MSRKKQTPWVVTILAIACLFSVAWYFLKPGKPSTMDTMQHPATSLPTEDACPIVQTTETINTPVALEVTTHEITELSQLQTIIEDGKPAVIKFYAPWCGACNHVESYYKR